MRISTFPSNKAPFLLTLCTLSSSSHSCSLDCLWLFHELGCFPISSDHLLTFYFNLSIASGFYLSNSTMSSYNSLVCPTTPTQAQKKYHTNPHPSPAACPSVASSSGNTINDVSQPTTPSDVKISPSSKSDSVDLRHLLFQKLVPATHPQV